ncbi:MAG: hypothetical protein GY696_40975 [Gammaproteobacteria bacterium]|nr:hypothetical protein [Gammaproteobacteria bacterium]
MKMFSKLGQLRRSLLTCGLCLLFVIPLSVMAIEDDDYLKMLDAETQKIDIPVQSNSTAGSMKVGDGFESGFSVDGFRNMLAQKYVGSSTFYSKLPIGSKEEVYKACTDGVSIREVRDLIIIKISAPIVLSDFVLYSKC